MGKHPNGHLDRRTGDVTLSFKSAPHKQSPNPWNKYPFSLCYNDLFNDFLSNFSIINVHELAFVILKLSYSQLFFLFVFSGIIVKVQNWLSWVKLLRSCIYEIRSSLLTHTPAIYLLQILFLILWEYFLRYGFPKLLHLPPWHTKIIFSLFFLGLRKMGLTPV